MDPIDSVGSCAFSVDTKHTKTVLNDKNQDFASWGGSCLSAQHSGEGGQGDQEWMVMHSYDGHSRVEWAV